LILQANVFSAEKLIPVLMHYISALFDRVRQIDQFLPQAVWKQCYRSLTRVVDALAEEPNIKLGTLSSDAMAAMATLMKNTKVDSSAAKKVEGDGGATQPNDDADESKSGDGTAGVVDDEVDEDGVLHVPGELAAFVLRMSSQFTKALQKTDPHTFDYVNRLEDESLFLELAEKTQAYYERQGDHNNATRLALRRMEHLYYKHDDIANALNIANIVRLRFGDRTMYHPACSSNAKALASIDVGQVHPAAAAGYPSVETPEQLDVAGTLLRLSTYIYANGNGETKTRAMLCHVFHHALHNRYYEARDLLLMSHIGDGIANADISTQILYNRTVAVVGLCAFRLGLMEECRNCLDEFAGGRGKKLLAQGISWRHPKYNQERDIAEENAEKRRLVPYHQHLNLELLECCYLTASMLEEIPKMADGRMAAKRDVYQKRDPYQYALEEIENQVFIGPPENTREHIHAASKALRIGNWEECASFVFKLDRVWSLVPGREKVKEQLLDKIKEVALRVYLLTYSTHYDSISQDELCTIFSLEENRIHSIVSKMMISQELRARWDQPTRTIVLHQVEPTKLQNLALELATKIEDLTEMNENMLERRVVNDSRDDGSDQRGFRNNYRDQYRPISTKFGQRRNIFGRFGGGRGRGRGGRGGGNRGGRGRWGRGGRGRFGAGRR
jgi:translation initiation factor 3 subunit C